MSFLCLQNMKKKETNMVVLMRHLEYWNPGSTCIVHVSSNCQIDME